jgi:hypothetical protein
MTIVPLTHDLGASARAWENDTTHRMTLTAAGAVMLASLPAIACAETWELVGRTYNSTGFVDRSRIVSKNDAKLVALLRISAQPADDGWKEVEQQLAINCATDMIEDRGSTVLEVSGRRANYPPAFRSKVSATTALYRSLFETVCHGKKGLIVADPPAWVRSHRVSD